MDLERIALQFRRYQRSREGAVAVEFVLVIPFLFLLFVLIIDAGNLFAQYRQAQQVAESVARAAKALDVAITKESTKPLSDDTITILRNVAARMRTQAPEGENYVWIGRFVQSQDGNKTPQQMLPAGLTKADNLGIVLNGKGSHAAQANQAAADAITNVLQAGDLIYVVDVTFSRIMLSPLPQKRLVFSVRYVL